MARKRHSEGWRGNESLCAAFLAPRILSGHFQRVHIGPSLWVWYPQMIKSMDAELVITRADI